MNGRKIRACLATVLSVLMLVGVHQATAGAQQPDTGDVSPMDVAQGELLRQGGSSYPRLIRLEHSGDANGRILASMTTYRDNAGFAVIHESTDDGKTWKPLSEIRDPAGEDQKGMCCSTLYELPKQVGDMPAGTLLWAGTAGIGVEEEQRQSSLRIWRSDDHGRTWKFLSTMVTGAKGTPGIWEPEFTVSKDGQLVGFYSDDSDPKHDQKMVQVRSKDGITWTDTRDMIKHNTFEVRPGMAGVRQLPDGTYVMTYEVCNLHPVHQCTVNMRTSEDGWNYGDPYDMGVEIVNGDGRVPTHTPTITVAPGGPNGRLILGYQKLVRPQGGVAEGNGTTLMVNDDPSDLSKGWYTIPSPVQIQYSRGSACRNFSPTMLPTADGKSVIHVTTDYEFYIPGVCEAFFGIGPIDPNAASVKQAPQKQKLDPREGR